MKFWAYLSSALESSQLKAASSPRSVASSYFIGRPAPRKRNERSRSDSMMQKAARLARHTKDRPFVVDPFFSPYPFPPLRLDPVSIVQYHTDRELVRAKRNILGNSRCVEAHGKGGRLPTARSLFNINIRNVVMSPL